MCGIAGVWWPEGTPSGARRSVDRMLGTIRHRGPDSEGRSSSPFAEVGFRRLSIIDLETGDQPLTNEDGRIECFLNGEIYNYRALREDLVRRGHRFRTSSDTEVLPHLYEELGEAMFTKLRGMFVVCIVDHEDRSVLLARDQFGVKQLYFARVAQGVVFCSEMKGLLASGLVDPEVDADSFLPYLALLYAPEPHTLVRGVAKLPPGNFLRLRADADLEPSTYYRLPTEPAAVHLSRADATERLAELFADSVALQLQADVPVGISLSGGVDSSAIACFSRFGRENANDLTALTISWPDTDPEEIATSRDLCRKLGITHEILEPDPGNFEDELPMLAWMSDEPVADPATLSQFRVAQAAGRRVRVLLGGAGGDELFGGYGHYSLSWKKRAYASLTPGLQRRLHDAVVRRWLDHDTAEALKSYRRSRRGWHRLWATHLSPGDEEALRTALGTERAVATNLDQLFWAYRGYPPIEQQLLVDLRSYLPEQLLPMMDRATMAASVEGRVPFLDVPLVEFCVSLSSRTKFGFPRVPKRLLKDLISDWVPPQVVRRKKAGMPSHFPLFIARHPEVVRGIILGPDAYARSVLPSGWLEARLGSDRAMMQSFPVLYALVVFEVWYRLFVVHQVYDRPDATLSELFSLPRPAVLAG